MSVFEEIKQDFCYIIENISIEHRYPALYETYPKSKVWSINCRNTTVGRKSVQTWKGMLNLVDLYYQVMKADPWRT